MWHKYLGVESYFIVYKKLVVCFPSWDEVYTVQYTTISLEADSVQCKLKVLKYGLPINQGNNS